MIAKKSSDTAPTGKNRGTGARNDELTTEKMPENNETGGTPTPPPSRDTPGSQSGRSGAGASRSAS